MDDFQKHLQEMMKDEGFRKRWEESKPCRDLIKEIIRLRNKHNISPKELEERFRIGGDKFYEIEEGNEELGIKLLNKMKVTLGENVETKAL